MSRTFGGLLAALLLAGCQAATAVPARGGPERVERVGLTEWAVATEGRPLLAGPDVLVITNAGATRHDLAVRSSSGQWRSTMLPPGGRTTLRLVTRPGQRLTLWCTVPGHEAAGMRTTLTVAG